MLLSAGLTITERADLFFFVFFLVNRFVPKNKKLSQQQYYCSRKGEKVDAFFRIQAIVTVAIVQVLIHSGADETVNKWNMRMMPSFAHAIG